LQTARIRSMSRPTWADEETGAGPETGPVSASISSLPPSVAAPAATPPSPPPRSLPGSSSREHLRETGDPGTTGLRHSLRQCYRPGRKVYGCGQSGLTVSRPQSCQHERPAATTGMASLNVSSLRPGGRWRTSQPTSCLGRGRHRTIATPYTLPSSDHPSRGYCDHLSAS